MRAACEVHIEGIGLWAAGLPGWQASLTVLRGETDRIPGVAPQPAATLMAPTERRRAPECVLLALEVGRQACTMAQRDPRTLPSVFASCFGDLAITDYLGTTLAHAPTELSPTKFHNSVHNAAAGYWTIATGSMAASTSISAGPSSFGAGLLEAALLAASEATPVLFAAYDTVARGPLAEVTPCALAFGTAFVLAPGRGAGANLHISLASGAALELAPQAALLHALYRANPIARSLPLLEALARRERRSLALPAGSELSLHVEISPCLS